MLRRNQSWSPSISAWGVVFTDRTAKGFRRPTEGYPGTRVVGGRMVYNGGGVSWQLVGKKLNCGYERVAKTL